MIATFAALMASARALRADEARSPLRVDAGGAAVAWTIAQLVPSPLLVVGTGHVGGGVRWQVTPLVYSFGVAEKPLRAFIVEPVARHAGAVELHLSPEWACCAPNDGTSWIGRAGVRLYVPIFGHGESLAWSIGGSYYRASDGDGFSADMGAYTLFGTIGLTVTLSPALLRREAIAALSLRYF